VGFEASKRERKSKGRMMKKGSKNADKSRRVVAGLSTRDAESKFRTIEPKILYFGTPVALVSSLNEDGTTDLSLISSFWALGWTMTLGLLTETKTAENFERHRECVVNLPSPKMWKQVEKSCAGIEEEAISF
jgi:flavin reductase (DIM6/NTAB) family NADH-FMN oxidoreductase RutF